MARIETPAASPSARELSQTARELFAEAPLVPRTLQTYRPYICPFDVLLEFVPASSTVLDIGCGAGLFLALLAKYKGVAAATGVDLNAQAISIANAMKERAHLGAQVEYMVGSASGELPGGEFDVVSMIDVLHHVPPEAQNDALRQAAAKVRPGGLFVFKDMGRRPHWRAAANRLHDLVVARQWINYCPIASVERWTIDRGFDLVTRDDRNMFWYRHELRVFRRRQLQG
jgi:2-polyprenyl-3-methyl-5-hydroxy-6-metoxy-1,4-benzoquinol methylase